MEDRNFVTVVSGLPRSGTSLMMQMLERGGLPVLTDSFRKADEDNPLGYYEFEAVKRLEKDASWIPDAYGKAVKIIYAFLYHLPRNYRFKIIFMKRDLQEVIASQKVMLRRRNENDQIDEQGLMDSFAEQLAALDQWLRRQDHLAVHYVEYGDVVAEPTRTAFEVSRFLGIPLNTDAMIESVKPSLHRNRASS